MNEHNLLTDQDLEPHVTAALELILQKYRRIDSLADEMLAGENLVGRSDAQMLELTTERDAIARLQAENSQLNERYRATRPQASLHVKQLTDQIGSLIQNLLMKMTKLERRAQDSCQQLLPQIHEGVRAVQMKNAYGKYS